MRILKYVLGLGLLVALVLFSYYLGRTADDRATNETSEEVVTEGEAGGDGAEAGEAAAGVARTVPEAGFTVDVSTLPPSRQSVLRTLGYEDTVTFTPEMVGCAEDTLGTERVAAIKAGATPSVLEVGSLMTCL